MACAIAEAVVRYRVALYSPSTPASGHNIMDDRKELWANRQILWGWLFLIAMLLLLLYLFFSLWWPRRDGVSGTVTTETATVIASVPASPESRETPLAEAQETLAAASLRPVESAAEVMAAAQTVVAATMEVEDGAPASTTPIPVSDAGTGTPSEDSAQAATSGLGWVDWVLGAIPGLTAIVTFVGLVVSSIMKWRTDLNSVSQAQAEFEREKLQFELQKQRHELDRVRETMELEQRRLELDLERERLALAQLRRSADADERPTTESHGEVNVDTEDDAKDDAESDV